MAAITPAFEVAPPAPGPVRYGLFAAATGPLELPEHGRAGGLQWEQDVCGTATLYTAECPPTGQDTKVSAEGDDYMTAAPFVVYAMSNCAPIGRGPEEHRRRAIARLMAGEQTAVETALWNGGGVGVTPALTLAGATTVVSAATGFAARIAALEEAFYDAYGYQGTVHVNTRAYGAAAAAGLIRSPNGGGQLFADGGRLQTPIGSVWSFGAGYDITGPANVAPEDGSVFAFITPNVTVYRSTEVNAPDPQFTFNRTTNQMYALAEREYVVGYGCPTVLAIEVPVETAATP
jgi:hypothetical protein